MEPQALGKALAHLDLLIHCSVQASEPYELGASVLFMCVYSLCPTIANIRTTNPRKNDHMGTRCLKGVHTPFPLPFQPPAASSISQQDTRIQFSSVAWSSARSLFAFLGSAQQCSWLHEIRVGLAHEGRH